MEATATEFQHLFEMVAPRVRPDFLKVRAYGKLGDRKCDGLFWGDGTVFQVYSPDEMIQADTLRKVKDDLGGAVAQWGDQLKRWVFVYNTRRGVAPDVPRILEQQQRDYPSVTIEPLSSEALWELVRGLSLQQRAEILGAPPGYEHVFLLPGTGTEEVERLLREGRFVAVHDVLSPVNIQDAVQALRPERPFGPPFYVRPPHLGASWQLAADYQALIVQDALQKARDLLPKFAVFSLAPIPLAIHLGYVLSDRVEVLPFQFDRDRKTWSWDGETTNFDVAFQTTGLPSKRVSGVVDAIVRVSLSAMIDPADTIAAAGECQVQVDLSVRQADVMWLRHPKQLVAFGQAFRSALRELADLVPQCQHVHLFYAGPTGGAIVAGQAINPRMNPVVELYEFDRRRTPRYEQVLSLK